MGSVCFWFVWGIFVRGNSAFLIKEIQDEILFLLTLIKSTDEVPKITRLSIRVLASSIDSVQRFLQDAAYRRHQLGEIELDDTELAVVTRDYKDKKHRPRTPFANFSKSLNCYLKGRSKSAPPSLTMFRDFTQFWGLRNRITHAVKYEDYLISGEDAKIYVKAMTWFFDFTGGLAELEKAVIDKFHTDIQRELSALASEPESENRIRKLEDIKSRILLDLHSHMKDQTR